MRKLTNFRTGVCIALVVAMLSFAVWAQARIGVQIISASVSSAPAAPTLTSATIPSAGTTISLLFSESVSVGAGGNAGWATSGLSGGAASMTYASGAPGTTLVYNLGRTVNSGETGGSVTYTQPGNGIEATTGGADVATIAAGAKSITNNSTAGSGPDTWYDLAAFSSGSSWWNNTTSAIASIEVTTGGTATKLRAYIYDVDGGTAFKLALYNADGSSLLGSCTVSSVTTGAWNECTMGAGVAVTSATRYRVASLSNANLNWGKGSGNSVYGFYSGSQTYASFPPATMTANDAADEDFCFGIYVD